MRRIVTLALAALIALLSFLPALPATSPGAGSPQTAWAAAPSCPDDHYRYHGQKCANKNTTDSNSDKNPKLLGTGAKKKRK